jgi:hypothetical protein
VRKNRGLSGLGGKSRYWGRYGWSGPVEWGVRVGQARRTPRLHVPMWGRGLGCGLAVWYALRLTVALSAD